MVKTEEKNSLIVKNEELKYENDKIINYVMNEGIQNPCFYI